MWISIYTSLSPLGSFNPPVHIYVHIHLFFYYTKRFLLIPRRLEEKIEIELLFSPAEFVNLSFCPLVFCRAKKISSLGGSAQISVAPREMERFSERRASWCKADRGISRLGALSSL